jgi:hypothetical protein
VAAGDLPAVESLSFESDFSLFLQPKVDETLRRQALKKLFSDPRFNVMDGLDVYIDDYGKPDPIAPELVRQLVQGRYLFDPPQTRVNAQGMVEDVPPDEAQAPAVADEAAGAGPTPAEPETAALPAAIPVRTTGALATLPAEPAPVTDITGARVLALLGDSVTTDHISPAGNIKPSRRKSSEKIDGMVALAMALGRIMAKPYEQPSVYETRGITFL